MRLAVVLLGLSGAPVAASSFACSLSMDCGGVFCADRTADVTASTEGSRRASDAVWTVSLSGTHQHPDWLDREDTTGRAFEGQQVADWQETSIRFADSQTVGTLSFDFGGKAALSLHIASADQAYFGHFTGICRNTG